MHAGQAQAGGYAAVLTLALMLAQPCLAEPAPGPSIVDVLNSETGEFDAIASEAYAEGATVYFSQRPQSVDDLNCVQRTADVQDCRYNVQFLRGRFRTSRSVTRAFERGAVGWKFLY